MKKLILLLVSVVWITGVYSQEYWGTYLPDATGWPDYYEENLYSMDTTTSPNVIKIDPSLSDPDRDYDNIMEWAEEQWSFYVPSNTILVWKSGTSDTIKKTVYGDKRSLYLSGVENVFIGTYGGTQKVKLFTDMIESNKEDKVSSIDFFGGTDRVWIDNIEFSHTGTHPWWWKSGVGDFYRWSNAFDIGIHFNQSGMTDDTFEKTIISRVLFNGVGDNIISGDYAWNISANTGAGTDTVVIVYCEDNQTLREGFTGEVFRARIYDNNWGSCNWEFLYDPNGYDDGHAGGDAIQLSFGASIRVPKYGKGNYYIQGNTINRQMGNKHTIFISDKDAAGAWSDADSRGSTVIVKDNEMTPPRDTTGGGGSNFMRNVTADSVYFINNRVWGGDYIPFDFDDHVPGQFYSCDGMRFTWFEGNIIENVTYLNFTEPGNKYWGGAPLSGTKTLIFNNNTFIDTRSQLNPNLGFLISHAHMSTMTLVDEWKNNLFLLNDDDLNYGGTGFYNNNGQLPDTSSCQFINGSSETWDSYFGIAGWENHNYLPTTNGRLHDKGESTTTLNNYSGLLNNLYDRNGTLRFSGAAQDIGALEYSEGVQSNLPPVILNQSFSVDENSPNNQLVGIVEAEDPDAGQTLTFSIQGGNTGGAFYIDSNSGELTVANTSAINFEQASEYSLTVKVQDNGPGNLTDQATITVNLNDVNEVPVIENQSFAIAQTIGNGELVGVVEASDPDEGQALTFSITAGNTDDAFQIDASSGELTVADNSVFDINVTPVYSLTVMVQDNGTGNLTDDATVTVTLEEVNLAPTIEDQSFNADENISAGVEVGIVAASDPNPGQTISFSILSGNTDGAFEIASGTGRLSVVNEEAVNFELNPEFNLVVQVEDDGAGNLTAEANITVTLNDVNEPPVVEDQNYVVEEGIANGELVGVVEADDPDQGQSLTFSITGGNADGGFAMNASTGELTVLDNSVLNFAQTPIYFLDIEVQDDGTGPLTDAAVIAVSTDEVNQAPVIEDQSFTLAENSPTSTVVGDLVAIDPDAGQNLTYSIVSGNSLGAFQLDETTGALSVDDASLFNYEENQSFTLVVEVEDDGIGNLTDEATVTVNLSDVNEAPVVESSTYSLVENSAAGMEVGTVDAEDPDNGQTLTFAIISGNIDDAFSVNSSSGMVSINNQDAINYEANEIFYLVIEVEDNGAGNLTGQGVVTVNIGDINETPEIEDQYFSVEENSPAGTFVGEVIAMDPDNGQTLTYIITSGNIQDAFVIDASTGNITVQNQAALDITVNPIFILEVEVVDNGSGNLSDQASVVIALMGSTSVGDATFGDFECNIYPNPAKQYVNLSIKNMESQNLNVKIIDFMGQIVFEKDYTSVDRQFEGKINLEGYSEGLYVIYLSNGDYLEKLKMIKQ